MFCCHMLFWLRLELFESFGFQLVFWVKLFAGSSCLLVLQNRWLQNGFQYVFQLFGFTLFIFVIPFLGRSAPLPLGLWRQINILKLFSCRFFYMFPCLAMLAADCFTAFLRTLLWDMGVVWAYGIHWLGRWLCMGNHERGLLWIRL